MTSKKKHEESNDLCSPPQSVDDHCLSHWLNYQFVKRPRQESYSCIKYIFLRTSLCKYINRVEKLQYAFKRYIERYSVYGKKKDCHTMSNLTISCEIYKKRLIKHISFDTKPILFNRWYCQAHRLSSFITLCART